MAMTYLKDSYKEIIDSEDIGLDMSVSDHTLLKKLAHSHGVFLAEDPDDLELSCTNRVGVFLSPPEITESGFYLFCYPGSNNEEYLIYSADYGKAAKRTLLPKGTVGNVLGNFQIIMKYKTEFVVFG